LEVAAEAAEPGQVNVRVAYRFERSPQPLSLFIPTPERIRCDKIPASLLQPLLERHTQAQRLAAQCMNVLPAWLECALGKKAAPCIKPPQPLRLEGTLHLLAWGKRIEIHRSLTSALHFAPVALRMESWRLVERPEASLPKQYGNLPVHSEYTGSAAGQFVSRVG
jgi:hypothetical protein